MLVQELISNRSTHVIKSSRLRAPPQPSPSQASSSSPGTTATAVVTQGGVVVLPPGGCHT
ncbi:hypothetical protein PAHAL_6G083900 [Panicum hallii]|uniref:Uncharacterized protein n=1 Tax=Panicum hallii TaxID=206008 RepID=A0A2T8IFN6_9POAL|nr:hypothetical protein PAHAL_6G083900 [Panicum hallii]